MKKVLIAATAFALMCGAASAQESQVKGGQNNNMEKGHTSKSGTTGSAMEKNNGMNKNDPAKAMPGGLAGSGGSNAGNAGGAAPGGSAGGSGK